jgi:hypothetical protein
MSSNNGNHHYKHIFRIGSDGGFNPTKLVCDVHFGGSYLGDDRSGRSYFGSDDFVNPQLLSGKLEKVYGRDRRWKVHEMGRGEQLPMLI